MFCVASVGAPGLSSTILVLGEEAAVAAPKPRIPLDEDGGTVSRGHVVYLECADTNARVFYTLDGSPPFLHRKGVKVRMRKKRRRENWSKMRGE